MHVKRYLCIEDYNYRYTVIRSEAICSLVSRKSILLQTILRNRKKEGIFFQNSQKACFPTHGFQAKATTDMRLYPEEIISRRNSNNSQNRIGMPKQKVIFQLGTPSKLNTSTHTLIYPLSPERIADRPYAQKSRYSRGRISSSRWPCRAAGTCGLPRARSKTALSCGLPPTPS